MGGGGTLVHDVPPSWVRASARLPPTVPRTQASWDETKVTEAASKSAMGAGAGVAGGAYADGSAVVTGRLAGGGARGGAPPPGGGRGRGQPSGADRCVVSWTSSSEPLHPTPEYGLRKRPVTSRLPPLALSRLL